MFMIHLANYCEPFFSTEFFGEVKSLFNPRLHTATAIFMPQQKTIEWDDGMDNKDLNQLNEAFGNWVGNPLNSFFSVVPKPTPNH
ncbi:MULTISPECIES: hypothetical protein [Vitreoscilla]|uniref:Uncharacterized protein n=1 Tax=Vitreoscilla stercoraria TaxID=61 RepID=A0ABY4EAW8_VITST|nr:MULTISPECIES: hypothetical protein [Vitreoscilla]QJQ52411.1 hypothetical protein ADP71_40750 [Vitreoscilla sp. C1]UOO92597.1 hypothetical protein LVJ81_00675 [Vitreoscilla stercoraria]